MKHSVKIELVWGTRSEVSESCVFDSRQRRILFADQTAGRIHAVDVDGKNRQSWQLPDQIASFGICRSGRFVVAFRRKVVFFDPRTGSIQPLVDTLDEPPRNKLNDGKVGPDGCFWVGSNDGRPVDEREPIGSLYRIGRDGTLERKSYGYCVSNGLAWSPDGQTMFHSDSSARYVDAWDFDPSKGVLSNRRQIARFTEAEGKPDGAACDAEGHYWLAAVQAGRLVEYSRDGKLLKVIELPIPSPTMPCFAGKWLYLTSMRRNNSEAALKAQPELGGLFRMPAPAEGATIALFEDE